jgi:hypothetical protein
MANSVATNLRLALILIGGVGTIGPAVAGNVVFDLHYIDEIQQNRPTVASYNVNQHVIVTLHDGNQVTEQRFWQSPVDSDSIGVSGAFGQKAAALKWSVKWKVVNANSLVRYREFPQHIEVLKIEVSGQTCVATITHNLKAGFSEYERFGKQWQPVFYSSLHSSGVTCSVHGG